MVNIKNTIFIFLAFFSCVDTQFQSPEILCEEVKIKRTTTLKHIKTLVRYGGYTFKNEAIISGYVISSDEFGNYYKRLVLQDNFKNPTAGITLLIDEKYLYTKYPLGQKIYIKLKGLTLNYEGKNIVLGKIYNSKTEGIASLELEKYVIRSCEKKILIPQKISYENIGNYENIPLQTLVRVENVQFQKTDWGKTFAGKKDTRYSLKVFDNDCNDTGGIVLETSKYASFASHPLPEKKGTLTGILNRKVEKKGKVTHDFKFLTIRTSEDFLQKNESCF